MRQFATDLFKNGKEGDVLKKNSDASMDFGFGEAEGGLPEGGHFGDILVSDGDGGAEWQAPNPRMTVLISDGDTIIGTVSNKIHLTELFEGLKFELSYEADPLDSTKYAVKFKVTKEGVTAPDVVNGAIRCRSLINYGVTPNIKTATADPNNTHLNVDGAPLVDYGIEPFDTYINFSFFGGDTMSAEEYVEEYIDVELYSGEDADFTLDTENMYNVRTLATLTKE